MVQCMAERNTMREFKPFEIDTEFEIKQDKNKRRSSTGKRQTDSKKKAEGKRSRQKGGGLKKDFNKGREEARRKRKMCPKRKKQLRRRRITTVVFALLIIFVAYSLLAKTFKKKEPVYTANSGRWYIGKVMEEKRGYYRQDEPFYKDANELSTIAQDHITSLERKLVPGYAHLTTANEYAYSTKDVRQYIRGEKEYQGKDKLVFLTFDDGPNRTVTPQILNILRDYGARGTFFLVGRNMTDKNIPVMKAIVNNGNSIALHSYSHDYDSLYPNRSASTLDILSEAKLVQERLQQVFGPEFSSHVWRYPGGHMSWDNINDSDDGLSKMGIEWIDWNSLSGDAEVKRVRPTTPEGMVEYVETSLNKNVHTNVAVVLMHDAVNKQMTVDALPGIIKYFKDNGYTFGILK